MNGPPPPTGARSCRARTLLSSEQRTRLFAIPTDAAEMARHYVLDADDLALVGAKRRAGNRLGFAVQLCALRHPGRVLEPSKSAARADARLRRKISSGSIPRCSANTPAGPKPAASMWSNFKGYLRLRSFGLADWRACLRVGTDAAWATDRGEPIVQAMLAHLRANTVLLPAATVLERIGLAARARARKKIFETLAAGLSDAERDTLDGIARGRSRDCAAPASPGCGIIRSRPRPPTSSRCWIVSNMHAGWESTPAASGASMPPASPG